MDSYNLLNKITRSYVIEDTDTLNSYDIHEKNDIPENCLDTIIEHPFVDTLNSNTYIKTLNPINILLYRLNSHRGLYYVEFYLINGSFLSIPYSSDIKRDINTLNISGSSSIKGYMTNNKEHYVVVQQRDSYTDSNWVTLWDVIVNESVYREKIQQNVISFFKQNNQLANLIQSNNVLMKPLVLYCHVDDKHRKYIQTSKSIQYCQNKNSCLINLHGECLENDNIRNICFIEENSFNICKNNLDIDQGYTILKTNNINNWLFNDDKYIVSYIK